MTEAQLPENETKRSAPILTSWDIQCMAYHEAGHAVCSFFSPEQEKLILVTIDPGNESFGMIRTKSRVHHNETDISMRGRIATLLSGRLAEQIFLNMTTTSCIHDLASASFIAMNMVTKFGMSKKYPFYSVKSPVSDEYAAMSDSLFRDLENEANTILNECGICAGKILREQKELVIRLSEILLAEKTVTEPQIDEFFKNAAGSR